MHLIESQKRAILELVIALQWADLRYDELDFLALGEIACALGSRISDAQLSDMVYQPADLGAADPTQMCALSAEIALSYATAVTLERPSRARREMLDLLGALLRFARKASANAHPRAALSEPEGPAESYPAAVPTAAALRLPAQRLSEYQSSTSSAAHGNPETSASKAA